VSTTNVISNVVTVLLH